MKKIIVLTIVILTLATATISFAQGVDAGVDKYAGWDCSNAATTGYCTRKITKGDTAWQFAGVLFNNNELWTRFKDDNPDKTKVTGPANAPILLWDVNQEIRIRRDDLTAIVEGKAAVAPNPVPVTIQFVEPPIVIQERSWGLLEYLMIPAAILGLLATMVVAYLCLRYAWNRDHNPAYLGPPQGPRDLNYFLGLDQPMHVVQQQFNNRIMPMGNNQIWTVNLTGQIGLEYGDGANRLIDAENMPIFVAVRYAREADANGVRQIEDVRIANRTCMNAENRYAYATTDANQTAWVFSNATIVSDHTGDNNLRNWQPIEDFIHNRRREEFDRLRNQTTQTQPTTTATEVEAPPISEEVTPSQSQALQMSYNSNDGLVIRGEGVIDLGNDMEIRLKSNRAVARMDRTGKLFLNDEPFDDTSVEETVN